MNYLKENIGKIIFSFIMAILGVTFNVLAYFANGKIVPVQRYFDNIEDMEWWTTGKYI